MARLTHRNLYKLHETIRGIYSILDADSLNRHVTVAASQLIPSSITVYGKLHQENQNQIVLTETSSVGECGFDYGVFQEHMHEHPFVNFLFHDKLKPHPFMEDIERAMRRQLSSFMRSPELAAVRISDVLKERQFRSLALYNEFFRPKGVDYQLGIPLVCDSGYHTVLNVNRDKKDFSEEERLMFGMIGCHIIQAYKNAGAYARTRKVLQEQRGGRVG